MSAIQKVLVKMAEEFKRLDEFLTSINNGAAQPSDKIGVLETEKVVILTRNHGYFVLDSQDIVKILQQRRDEYEADLKNRTFMGEDISKLRAPLE